MNYRETLSKVGHLLNKPVRPKKGCKFLPKVSKKREGENRIYLKKRRAFLQAHPCCQAWAIIQAYRHYAVTDALPQSTEIHHVAGRIGNKLLDEKDWLAVSRFAHTWIHAHPSQARMLGLLK